MDRKFEEMLSRIADLSDQELVELEKALTSEFHSLDKGERSVAAVKAMREIADAVDRIGEESDQRVQAANEAEAEADEARSRIAARSEKGKESEQEDAPPDAGTPPEVEYGGPGGEIPPRDDPDPNKTVEPKDKVPVAASGKPGLGQAQPSGGHNPAASGQAEEDTSPRVKGRWLSVGAVRGPATPGRGTEFTDRETLAMATAEAIQSLGRGSGDPVLVASLIKEYPTDRTLSADPEDNSRKVDAVTSPKSLVATGGICGPVAVDYDLTVVSSDDEPIAAALPDFNASRGGVRFLNSPTFTQVGASGTGIWTAATDATPGGSTKPIQTITCGTEVVVLVDAIPTRLRFGNMMSRFSPEIVDANTTLAMANAARVREIYRLGKIAAASTPVSTGKLLGAARDFLATIDQAKAAYRYRHRVADDVRFQALLPSFLKDMIRADFTRELANDSDRISLTDAQVEQLLRDRGVDPVWLLDGQAGATVSGLTFPLQGYGAQGAGAILQDWISPVVWYLYVPGTFQRLDGGRLDVGVVRDSVLDSTNDYEVFVESFEGVAFRGLESLQLISQLRPNGGTAGTISTLTY